jgi:isopentenyl-diphosphate delta-isomerase
MTILARGCARTMDDGHQPRPTTRDVVLLDPATDQPIATMGKHAAHQAGLYHAAISVILVDRAGRQLLQQRAFTKYHCPGLWSNACCSHPMAGETSLAAAQRRLFDELRLRTPLTPLARVRYKARVGRLIEHECVDVFVGLCATQPRVNPKECAGVAWMSPGRPDAFEPLTPWSALYLDLFGFAWPRARALAAGTEPARDFGPVRVLGEGA